MSASFSLDPGILEDHKWLIAESSYKVSVFLFSSEASKANLITKTPTRRHFLKLDAWGKLMAAFFMGIFEEPKLRAMPKEIDLHVGFYHPFAFDSLGQTQKTATKIVLPYPSDAVF